MNTSTFCSWVTSLRNKLIISQQRCLVVLNGDLAWANNLIESLIINDKPHEHYTNSNSFVAFGEQCSAGLNIVNNYRHQLGTENDFVFFADEHFHPDAFAALSGTIKAGGIMFWLCTDELINNKNNLFIQRLWQQVVIDDNSLLLNQEDSSFPELEDLFNGFQVQQQTVFTHPTCRTAEQLTAVEAIEKVANGHRNRPLVLTADRGRGKSSALAIAVANLINKASSSEQENALSIMITASHRDAVNVFFTQLAVSCANGQLFGDSFTYQNHTVQFIPVDVLVSEQPKANLLLIDEAAAIPIYLLTILLERYHRLVFSSTVHGYEGAGRGFAINFIKILRQKMPEFVQLHIHQPIRWCENDPLEQLIFNSFLLAPMAEVQALSVNNNNDHLSENHSVIQKVTQQQLFENEMLLQQVFTILVTAHYQTSPSDLKFLLNNPALNIFVSFAADNTTVIAVALALNERQASAADIQLALASKKRLKDQFLPQSLLLHCGIRTAFEYQYLRIVRIAVQPHLQGRGIGGDLLTFIEAYAKKHQFDFVGTSFGVNKDLVNFWGKANYHFARIGFTQDKASGEHSCLLLKSFSSAANQLLLIINQQFYQRFNYYLAEQFQHVNPEIVQCIYQQANSVVLAKVSKDDISAVEDFIARVSLYDACAYSLSVWLRNKLTQSPPVNIELLIAKVLQRRSTSDLCRQYQLTGKKALNNMLISQVTTLYND